MIEEDTIRMLEVDMITIRIFEQKTIK